MRGTVDHIFFTPNTLALASARVLTAVGESSVILLHPPLSL